ncbi:DUF368 domain-containing protein [Halomonas huangheensis]|uniref:DUF368 domain-containing protein n=1 Tax=Halomonas huangheensis TaxID=1178482 RepID=W1N5B1_9GAMM|nr:DUF368 domain-containing protein [Halomonas huangheensis]ALM51641.1 hypothetical protein AR456_04575 [Halomonas huangheensis]ERL50125.1 hypothetical protein BJB45_03090 [Halomonas huangheensis]
MKRYPGIFLRGLGMGAADAVPGVSGGTIAFITGIYEELIESIKRFGPSAFAALRQRGLQGLVEHLNLGFLVPLLAGIALSVVSVAHAVVWLLDNHPLLLNGFFFGLVAASAVVVARHPVDWRWWYILPLASGLLLAQGLPALMPAVNALGSPQLVLMVAGAIAISAMLLPGVSGSFLLLSMGLYDVVMGAVRGFDIALLVWFAGGCVLGLVCFSRLLSWLLRHYYGATLQMLLGFIIGSMPVLWPWRELIRYQLGGENQIVPLDYRYLAPWDYSSVTGEPAQLLGVTVVAVIGMLLVLVIAHVGNKSVNNRGHNDTAPLADKEKSSDA